MATCHEFVGICPSDATGSTGDDDAILFSHVHGAEPAFWTFPTSFPKTLGRRMLSLFFPRESERALGGKRIGGISRLNRERERERERRERREREERGERGKRKRDGESLDGTQFFAGFPPPPESLLDAARGNKLTEASFPLIIPTKKMCPFIRGQGVKARGGCTATTPRLLRPPTSRASS